MLKNIIFCCAFILLIMIFFISSVAIAMDEIAVEEHEPIDLRTAIHLSPSQLKLLHNTGHIFTKSGWYHLGNFSYWDPWFPYYNEDMENIRLILDKISNPIYSVSLMQKLFIKESVFIANKTPACFVFRYKIETNGYWSNTHTISLYPGQCRSTWNLAQKLKLNTNANRKPTPGREMG